MRTFSSMDQILPILIAAVVFGFQAYANYQKEQQKAKNRKFGPPPTAEREPYEATESRGREYPGDTEVIVQEIRQAVDHVKNNPYGRYEGTFDPSLSRRSRIKKEAPIQEVTLTNLDDEDEDDAAFNTSSFNLRDAVIQAAILERPYKD